MTSLIIFILVYMSMHRLEAIKDIFFILLSLLSQSSLLNVRSMMNDYSTHIGADEVLHN